MAIVRTSVPGSGYDSVYIDALVWGGTAWDPASGEITYHFGEAIDFADASSVHGAGRISLDSSGLDAWSIAEKDAFRYALSLYSSVSGLTFKEASPVAGADIVWWQQSLLDEGAFGIHEIPDADGRQIWGAFDPRAASWGFLAKGGDGLYTIIHEIGHAVGLAHPHDGGGEVDATIFAGVLWPGDSGDRRLNQGVATVMSYNNTYDLASGSIAFGSQGGLGAFDIAALQALYGANMNTRTGDDVYDLPLTNTIGTGWSSIWDAGGIDTISGAGSTTSVTIDLRAATLLKGAAGGGGFISQAGLIGGGFTIANGVVVENAIGGSRNDRLVGNSGANVLDGRGGADSMNGGAGDDTYYVNTSRDTIADTSGRDIVYASVSYTLPSATRIEILGVVDPGSKKSIALTGNPFANTIKGNAGSNIISGKGGNDLLTGGPGRDAFVFDTKLASKTNVDRILDFSVHDDTIRLDNSIFRAFDKTGTPAAGAFHIAKSAKLAHDADDRIIYNKTNGYLYYDADGIGGESATKFARVDEGLALKVSDFYIV